MTLYTEVLERLGKAICAGRYPPGQAIPPEPLLCAQYNVSRIVVREAIKGLVSKGMLETRRRTGTVVLDPARWSLLDPQIVTWRAEENGVDLTLANDIMELRRIVEPAAARLSAERASATERKELRAAYEAMARAVAGDGDYVAADLAFHEIIIRTCANPFVTQLQGVIFTVLRIGFERLAEIPGGPARSLPLHREICDAIVGREGLRAERAVLDLLAQSEIDLRERLRLHSNIFLVADHAAPPPAGAERPASARRADLEPDPRSTTRPLEERHVKVLPP